MSENVLLNAQIMLSDEKMSSVTLDDDKRTENGEQTKKKENPVKFAFC